MNPINLAYQKISDPTDWLTSSRIEFLDTKIVPLHPLLLESELLPKLIDKWIEYEVDREIIDLQLNYEDLADHDPSISSVISPTDTNNMRNIVFYAWLWWNSRLESLYLSKKSSLDQISCRLLTVSDKYLAYELYMRLKEKESTFDQLSIKYGIGPERFRGGVLPSQPLSSFSPQMQKLLASMSPGQLIRPFPRGDNYCLLRLESRDLAEFNDTTKNRLLVTQFNEWKSELLSKILDHLSSNNPQNFTS